jgi:hypothetical protein
VIFVSGSPHVLCESCSTLTRLVETTKAAEPTGRKFPLTVLCHPPPPRVTGAARVAKRVFLPEYARYAHVCPQCAFDLAVGKVPRLRGAGVTPVVEDRRPRLVKKGV